MSHLASIAKKTVLPLALGAAAWLAATAAQARDLDVRWSVTIGVPGLVVSTGPAVGVPVYAAPVYPVPVYAAPVYAVPAPVYGPPRHRHPGYAAVRPWDRDGDGIPNRFDPVYNPRWDRDGDGIPNRYDRRDDRRYVDRRDDWRR